MRQERKGVVKSVEERNGVVRGGCEEGVEERCVRGGCGTHIVPNVQFGS